MKHVFYKCDKLCNGCQYCSGGLEDCINCSGAEGSLTTDCPNSNYDSDLVFSGKIDHVNGKWYDLEPKLSWSTLRKIHEKYKNYCKFNDKPKNSRWKWVWYRLLHEYITGKDSGLHNEVSNELINQF